MCSSNHRLYDPLLAVPRLLGARLVRFERRFDDGFRVDPARVAAAITPATRLIVLTSLHNPAGSLIDVETLREIGRIAERHGAHVLVDEVYLDAAGRRDLPAGGDPGAGVHVDEQPDEGVRAVGPPLRLGPRVA